MSEQVVDRIKEALEMALAMLDPENQPPQWTREEAVRVIYEAKRLLEAA